MQMHKQNRKASKAFTLIEICTAVAILVVIAGVLGWHIHQIVSMHRFHHQVDQLTLELRKLQTLALTYQTDIELKIYSKGNQFHYSISSDSPIQSIKPALEQNLPNVRQVLLNNSNQQTIQLKVSSTGAIEPKGIIKFYQAADNQDQGLWLDFRQPLLIKLFSPAPKNLEDINEIN